MKKVLEILSALLIISVLAFIFLKLAPGDAAENYLRASHIPITDKLLETTRESLGLNKPLVVQYLLWLKRACLGDFGKSYLLHKPALTVTIGAFKHTLVLGCLSFILIVITTIPLGIYSAMNEDSKIEKLIQFFSFISVSMPVFWLGFLLILLFSVKLNILPVSGKGSYLHYVLPVITLAFPFFGQYITFVKKLCQEEIKKYYFENALMRGLKKKYFIKNYIWKSIRVSIMSTYVMTFAGLITGAILVENIFSWPGIGRLFVGSIQASDIPVIQACMILFGFIFIIFNSCGNMIAYRFDPKMSNGRSK